MKVKKLLTLLVVTSLLAGCNVSNKKSDSSSANNQSASNSTSAQSSDFSSFSSSSSVEEKSSSSQGGSSSSSSSSAAPSSSSSAPASSSSSAAPSSSSSAPASSSSSAAPSSSSSAAPSSSSSAAPSSSSSAAPSSSSAAPSSSSSASSSSSSSSSLPATVLESITVTPPTKLEYTTADTALDLTGMVVTGNYSDGQHKALAAGWVVSTPDFTQVGQQVVTVTYTEGNLTDTFTINVTQDSGVTWSDEAAAAFAAALCGYVPPYFDSEALGYGVLKWYDATDGDGLIAIGDSLSAPAEGEPSPLKALADIFVAAGFVISAQPDAEKSVYHYAMDKEVTYQNEQRFIRVRLATTDDSGRFRKEGKFYFEIMDAYYYNWEASGFEAEIKKNLSFVSDIPDFQDGARFLKSDKDYFVDEADGGYVSFTVYGASADYCDEYLDVLEAANWEYFNSTREDYLIDAVSPDAKTRIGLDYDKDKKELEVYIDEVPNRPAMVGTVAAIYQVSPYAFTYSSDNGNFFYQFNNLTLGEGEDWGTLIDRYAATLTADAGSNFTKKGERVQQTKSWYDKYVDADLGIMVVIFAFDSEAKPGTCGVQITVEEYAELPAEFEAVYTLLGVNLDEVSVSPASESSAEYAYAQIKSEKTVDYKDAMKAVTDILDADTTLNFKVIYALNDTTMQTGEAAQHVEYANDSVRIEILAWTGTDNTIVQIRVFHYTPAPTSEWLDTVLGILNDLDITWDDEDQVFGYADYRELGKRETLNSVVKKYANKLLNSADLDGIFKLLEISADATDDYPEAKTILSCDFGSIEFKYGEGYGDLHAPVFFCYIRFFDTSIDATVNDIGALTGASLALEGEGAYGGNGTLKFSGGPYGLPKYGSALLEYYVAADLLASSLNFKADESEGAVNGLSGNNYVGTYKNDEGYVVVITLYGDADKNYTGYYHVTVTMPQQA